MNLLGNESHRLNALQYVRAICALGVVLLHVEGGINAYWKFENQITWFTWGHLGVPMFFCLSGFVISYSGYLRSKKFAEFLLSRISRIYPVYLAVALLFVSCVAFLPPGVFTNAPSLSTEQVVKTIFFDFGGTGGYVYVGWTLFYEMMFYLCFSLISFRFAQIAKSNIFYYLLSFCFLLCYAFSLHRIADFLYGVSTFLIACNPNKGKIFTPPNFTLFIVFSAGLFVHPVGVFCSILILTLLFVEKYKPVLFGFNPFLVLGDSSYSIYLVQVLTVSASLKAAKLLAPLIPLQLESYYEFYILAVFLSCLTTIVAGILLRRHLEKPSYQLLMSIKK